jgi:geranylgeranyl diphosphate synthase type II
VTIDLDSLSRGINVYLPRALEWVTDAPYRLREAMAYSLLAPGKRLRPALVLLACEAAGGDPEFAIPAAAAVEMVHTYSLIHDDLPAMDDDDFRRGRLTCHKQYGEALAILAGDSLLTLAFEVITRSYSPFISAFCCRELARGAGAAGMVGGQVEDIAWENDPTGAIADLERVHARKTGSLFRASLQMGAVVAGAEPTVKEALDAYGRGFGQAFQITDDLLDVEGTAADAGKAVNKDAARGKLTYPGLLGVEESRRRAAEQCRSAAESLTPLGQAGEKLVALLDMIVNRSK